MPEALAQQVGGVNWRWGLLIGDGNFFPLPMWARFFAKAIEDLDPVPTGFPAMIPAEDALRLLALCEEMASVSRCPVTHRSNTLRVECLLYVRHTHARGRAWHLRSHRHVWTLETCHGAGAYYRRTTAPVSVMSHGMRSKRCHRTQRLTGRRQRIPHGTRQSWPHATHKEY